MSEPQEKFPNLDALMSAEADLRGHVLARVGDFYQLAQQKPDLYIGRDVLVGGSGKVLPVELFRLDSRYPVLTEENVLEPNHLLFSIPEGQQPDNMQRFWVEWDVKRKGKWAELVDWEGARRYPRFASERERAERIKTAQMLRDIGELALTDDVMNRVRESATHSIDILTELFFALTEDRYHLAPYRPVPAI